MTRQRLRALLIALFSFVVLVGAIVVLSGRSAAAAKSPPNLANGVLDTATPTSTPIVCDVPHNYAIATATATIDPATNDLGLYCDDCETPVSLPFAFKIYTQTFTSMVVNANGYAVFPVGGVTPNYNNQCLPTSRYPRVTIFAYWDDLRVDAAGLGVFTSVTGTAPNRIFNVEWRAIYFHTEESANFELRLHENGGINQYFDVIYGPVGRGSTDGTVGVQLNSDFYTQYFCNGAGDPILSGKQLIFSQPTCLSPTPTITGTPYTSTPTITPTPTATGTLPTLTFTPTPTWTPTPTSTSSLNCYLRLDKATTTCIQPDTFTYRFDWVYICGIGTTGYVYFEIAPSAAGPWTIHWQSPLGTWSYGGTMVFNDIPQGYSWYRFRQNADPFPPHYGWHGETDPEPICGGYELTATPTPTYTLTATPINTGTNTPTPTITNTPTTGPSNTPTLITTNTAVHTFTNTPIGNTATVVTFTPTSVSTHTPTEIPQTPTLGPTQCAVEFTDVPASHTFFAYVECLVCRGIVSGYNSGCETGNPCFKPGNSVTRGQLSKIVSNAAGFEDTPDGAQFEDVAVGSTFYDFVWRLANRGIVRGYDCGGAGEPCAGPGNLPYFRPNANVTRGQLSKITAEAAGFVGSPGAQQFEDVPVGSTFFEPIWALADRGIVGGYDCGEPGEPCVPPGNLPYFRTQNGATRGQASKIVARTFFPACADAAP